MQHNEQIEKWFETKKKLHSQSDLQILKEYLVDTDQNIATEVYFSSDYEFSYFDLSEMNCKKINVRPENVFKINFDMIVKKLKKYFPETKIIISFEAPSENDMLIKKYNCTYKHDVCIKLVNKNNETYDIALEYFEYIHDRIKDDDKDISSKVILDGYYVYQETDNNFNEYMKETIYNIMISICAVEDNPYTLSKINFFNNYKNIRSLKTDTVIFNNIMKWKKENSVNLYEFFKESQITNLETNKKFKFDEFIEYLEEKELVINFIDDKYNCEYNYITDIIMIIDTDCSQKIYSYRKIYIRSMEILFESQKQIIKYIKQMNKYKKLIPQYIDSFLRVHIQNYRYTDTQNKVISNLQHK